jgi:Kdo2-lipid IVA lauroyltransferase/acyltransferase
MGVDPYHSAVGHDGSDDVVRSAARMRRRGSAVAALGVLLLAPVAWTLAHLPARLGLWLGRRVGDLAWIVLAPRRAVALDNLRLAFRAERGSGELRHIGRRSFQHLGMNLVEACVLMFRPSDVLLRRMEIDGLEHLKDAVGQGRGVLLLTAHLGNWELLAAAHPLTGLPLSVVLRPLDQPQLGRVVERLRRRTGAELISKRRALRDVLDALRRGRMVGILLDQNATRAEGIFVPFFGTLASTSRSLAVLALRTEAPVVPVFIRRLEDGRHLIEVRPLLPPPEGDVVALTACFNETIEAAIRRAPEQWFWLHRRWKTRPRPKIA